MGVWSEDIFGNDLTSDVRDEFQERIAAGDDLKKVVQHIRKEFAEEMRDVEERWSVWIALAALQMDTGEVLDDVRKNALKGIAWCENPEKGLEHCPFGAKTLVALREKLGGPLPKSSKPKPKVPPGKEGGLLAIRLPDSGGEVAAIVTGDCDRGPEYAGLVLLRGLKVDCVTERALEQALSDWQPYRRDWGDRLGALYGVYSVTGKLGPKKARLVLGSVKLPPSFAAHVRGGGPIERAADIPHVFAHALWNWDNAKWTVAPEQ